MSCLLQARIYMQSDSQTKDCVELFQLSPYATDELTEYFSLKTWW